MKTIPLTNLLAGGLLTSILLLPQISRAALAEDSFEAYPTGAVAGANGGTGWGGAWAAPIGTAIANVVDATASPLTFTPVGGLPAAGGTNALEIYSSPLINAVAAARQRGGALPAVFYVSYLVRLNAGASWAANNTFSVHLANSAVNSNSINFGIRSGTAGQFMVRSGTGTPGANAFTGGTVAVGTSYFLVARISKIGSTGAASTTYDRAEIWLNPAANDNLVTANGDARLQLATGTGLASISHVLLRQAALDADDRIWLDRLTLGASWEDVVPLAPDTSAPVVTITTPSSGTPYAPGIPVNVTATATDDRAVSSVQLFLDGSLYGSDDVAPHQFVVTNLSLGAHTLAVLAADPSGNVGSNVVNLTVSNSTGDTTPPAVTITAPANGASFSAGAVVNVTATITDNVAMQNGELFVDGVSQGADVSAPYAWTVSNLTPGARVLAVRGLDTSGNAATNSITLQIADNPPPAGGTNIIYTELTDQVLKLDRATGVVALGGETESSMLIGGSGSGAGVDRCGVTVFKLPNLGPVANPFTTANFGIYHISENVTGWNGDLYGLGRRASPTVQISDYWGHTNVLDSTDAVLLQNNFLVPTGLATNTLLTTSLAGSEALRNYLNAQYANGAGIGQYVFLRLNSDAATSGTARYNLSSADAAAGNLAQTPQITYTSFSQTRFENCSAIPGFFSGMDLYFEDVTGLKYFVWSSANIGLPVANWTLVGQMNDTPLGNDPGRSVYGLNVTPTASPTYYLIGKTNVGPYFTNVPAHKITSADFVTFDFANTNTTISLNGVLALNNSPGAVADNATTPEDVAVTINVLANDTDSDPNAVLSLVSVSSGHGTAVLAGTNVHYTPALNFNGTNVFSYVLSDGGTLVTGAVTVVVSSVNDAPVAAADAATTTQDVAVTINVLANDFDVDGDSLMLTNVTTGSGTASIVGTNVLFTPAAGFSGTNVFSYEITDGSRSATGLVTVVVTAAPVLAGITANPDHSMTLSISVASGQSYQVLAATNLVPPVLWNSLITNISATTNLTPVTDTNTAEFPTRFYRLVSP